MTFKIFLFISSAYNNPCYSYTVIWSFHLFHFCVLKSEIFSVLVHLENEQWNLALNPRLMCKGNSNN